jgi:hypothetical protein
LEELAQVPDPRSRRGTRHPLPAILGLTVLAMLSGCRSYTAIAQFGRDKGFPLAMALGFRRGKTPTKSRLSTLFRRLDVTAFEAALSRWVMARLGTPDGLHVCIDGKALRGSKDGDVPGHHLVAAYAPSAQAVLAQLRVDAKTNEHKAALRLLGIVPVAGCIFSGDAAFCQRDFCQEVIDGGGDYVLFVKDNQPGLAIDVAAGLAFEGQKRRQAAAFPPLRGGGAAARRRGAERGQGARPGREADDPPDGGADQGAAVQGLEAGV